MFFGQLETGERVSALKADKTNRYICPVCGSNLILKQGKINAWHFAHESGTDCDAFTENKMTKWHIWHQEEFPEECREVRLEDTEEGRVWIADIKCGNMIIEFQHSPMDIDTFERRSAFYSKYGRLVWVFDFREKYQSGQIGWYRSRYNKSTGCFRWDWPNKLLGEYHLLGCGFDVFVQLDEDLYCLVEWNPRGMKFFNGRKFTHAEFKEYLRNIYRGKFGVGGLNPRRIEYDPDGLFMYNFDDEETYFGAGNTEQ